MNLKEGPNIVVNAWLSGNGSVGLYLMVFIHEQHFSKVDIHKAIDQVFDLETSSHYSDVLVRSFSLKTYLKMIYKSIPPNANLGTLTARQYLNFSHKAFSQGSILGSNLKVSILQITSLMSRDCPFPPNGAYFHWSTERKGINASSYLRILPLLCFTAPIQRSPLFLMKCSPSANASV